MLGSIQAIDVLPITAALISTILGILSLPLTTNILKKVRLNKKEELDTEIKRFVDKLYEVRKKGNDSLYSSITIEGNSRDYTVSDKDETTKDEVELAVQQYLMEVHQKQALMHSRVQFYVGIVMSIIGFIFFTYIVFMSINSANNIGMGLKILGSLIFEGISLLFLKESHKLRESSKEYHDNLNESNKHQQAIKIANSISDLKIKSAIQAQLSLHLIGVPSDNIDITKIIESQKHKDEEKKATY